MYTGKKPAGPMGGGGPPPPGPGKFATVAGRTSNAHSDIPNQWRGSQDDGMFISWLLIITSWI